MRIIHLSHSDKIGGATNFALRIIGSLDSIGLHNTFLVSSMQGRLNNTHVVSTSGNKKLKILKAKLTQSVDKQFQRLEKPALPVNKSTNLLGCVNSRILNNANADLIHLHWINGGLISIKQLGKLSKPVLWTMSDMWPFLGTEHYVLESNEERFLNGYKKENRNSRDLGLDLDRIVWSMKSKNFQNLNLVAPSNWLALQAKRSLLFREKEIHVIAPPIDVNLFKPLDSYQSRGYYGLNQNDFTIGFLGGVDIRKGWNFVSELIKYSDQDSSWRFIIGGIGGSKFPEFNGKVIKVGAIRNENELVRFYSALDVLLVPSIQEAFGLVAQEAQSCGIPVIVFDDTGCAEIVAHNETGFALKKRSANEIFLILRHLQSLSLNDKSTFKRNSRERAKNLWSFQNIARKYENIYQDILYKFKD